MNSDVNSCVNICSGRPIYIRDYVMQIARIMGKEDLVVFKDKPSNQPKFIVGDNTLQKEKICYNISYSVAKAIKEILQSKERK